MTLRRVVPVLFLLFAALLLAPSTTATPFVNDGTCSGVEVGGTFTGQCAAPCRCPGYPCQDWYALDTYLFHACWA